MNRTWGKGLRAFVEMVRDYSPLPTWLRDGAQAALDDELGPADVVERLGNLAAAQPAPRITAHIKKGKR